MEAYVNNQQKKIPITDQLVAQLEEVIRYVMEKEKFKNYEIGVTLVDDKAIMELNNKFRNKNIPTDVLSFPLSDDKELHENSFVVGDIVISMETAKGQAKEYNHSLNRETVYLLVHGIYHILGFTHDKEEDKSAMRVKEEEILKHFQISR